MSSKKRKRSPECYTCEKPVAEWGDFCSEECWVHWHWVIPSVGDRIELPAYKDLTLQPWFGTVDQEAIERMENEGG